MTKNHQNHVVETTDEKPQEDWMARRWRPAMGWLYMAVCACDFIVFPILWSMVQAVYHILPFVQWQPLTLQGAGLFHIAMGAVLGIAAYGRTKEKMAGAEQGGLHSGMDLSQGFGPGAGTTYTPPGMQPAMNNNMGGYNNPQMAGYNNPQMSGSYGSPQPGGYGQSTYGSTNTTPPSFGTSSPAPIISTTPPPAFGGKPSGPTQTFPAL